MEALIVDKISTDWQIGSGAFPFELCRQTRARPVRIRIRFEIAEVRNRFCFVDRSKTGECEIPPRAIAFDLVKAMAIALLVDRCPTERKPTIRLRVTAGCHDRH